MYNVFDIIDSIDNIEDTISESETSVMNSLMDSYTKTAMILENYKGDDIDSMLMFMEDGSSGMSKVGQFLKKIWKTICSVFKFIVDKIKSVIDFVKNKSKKSKNETPDQILDDLGIKPKTDNVQEAVKPVTKAIIKIPNGKGSFTKEEISLAADRVIVKFNSDETFSVKSTGRDVWLKQGLKTILFGKAPITGQYAIRDVRLALVLIVNKNIIQYYTRYFEGLSEIINNIAKGTHTSDAMSEFEDKMQAELDKIDEKEIDDFSKVRIKISDLQSAASQISELSMKLDKFQDINLDVSTIDDRTVKCFNDNFRYLMEIQMSFNSLTANLSNNNLIGISYLHAIDDIEVLDEFVNRLIKAGVPPKYVARNAYLVCDKKYTDGIPGRYKWGQTRAVLFPVEKDYVIKIALSGVGVVSNNNEARISDYISKHGGDEWVNKTIAPVTKTYTTGSIIEQRKVSSNRYPGPASVEGVKFQINEFIRKHKNIGSSISHDIHEGNIAFNEKSNNWVCIDYGFTTRENKEGMVDVTGNITRKQRSLEEMKSKRDKLKSEFEHIKSQDDTSIDAKTRKDRLLSLETDIGLLDFRIKDLEANLKDKGYM